MTGQRLGQNFLADAGWRLRIARAVLNLGAFTEPVPGGVWLEIGGGHGEMTMLLAPHAGRVVAVELDPKLLPRLTERTEAFGNVTVVSGDVLAQDLTTLAGGDRYRVYGNLPYYISSPILHLLFEHAANIDEAFVVVQLEVAERMTARPGTHDFAYLSAFTQFHAHTEIMMRIPPGAFRPIPKVTSALVALRFPGERASLGITNVKGFQNFLKACFAQKRKTLRNNLRPLTGAVNAEQALREAGLASDARAEQLELKEFAKLFFAVGALAPAKPSHDDEIDEPGSPRNSARSISQE